MNLRAEYKIYQYQVILLGYGGDGACGDRRDCDSLVVSDARCWGFWKTYTGQCMKLCMVFPPVQPIVACVNRALPCMADVQVPVSGREATVFRSRSWRQPCAAGFENDGCWRIEMPCRMDWPAATRRSGMSPETCVKNGRP